MKIIFYLLVIFFTWFLYRVWKEIRRRKKDLLKSTSSVDIPLEMFVRYTTTPKGERAKLVGKDIRGNEYEFEYEDFNEYLNALTVIYNEHE
jgi:hypothetical protein